MKAWLIDGQQGIEKLRLADVADPVAAPGEVVLAVKYAALNPADRYLAEGQYPAKPAWPHILGRDAVGIVVERGAGTGGEYALGSKWMVLRGETGVNKPGTFAERVAVAASSLVAAPGGWSDEESAGATLVYLTAYQAITQWADLPAKSVVLITGASGGVGVASTQLAHAMGHTVVALSRDPQKQRRLRELGAEIALDPQDAQWRKSLKEQLAGRRVDLAIDSIGGPLLPQVVETLGDRGRVSVVGRLAGPVPEFNTASLFFRRIKVGGVAVGSYTNSESRAAWDEVVKRLGTAGAKPRVDRVFAFGDLPRAFARLREGPMGKVLLAVNA
jgi:NADPH2:quinone reductase